MAQDDLARRVPPPPLQLPGGLDLPHNLEAEQAVLGALLIDETAFDQVAPVLKIEDFYLLAHQHVYAVCVELSQQSKAVDPVLIQQRLEAKGLLGAAVPADLVFTLFRGLGTAANVTHYAAVVADLARLRRMMMAAQAVVARGHRAGDRVGDFLQEAQAEIAAAAEGSRASTLRTANDAVNAALDKLEQVHKRELEGKSHITGVPAGLPSLDDKTLGFQPGALVILAARPSVGKTALALNFAAHAAVKMEKRVAFFSLEMPSDQLAMRLLAADAKLDSERVAKGKLAQHDWEKVGISGERVGRARIWFDDNFVLSPLDLLAKCRKIAREAGGLDMVVVDYLQLMQAPASNRASQSREQEIATISRGLKALAKELACPVLALSQLNRAVEKRKGERPVLADLRESGAIEQDADIVMFLHRPEPDKEEQEQHMNSDVVDVELVIAKHRQGALGIIPLVFFRRYTLFAEKTQHGGGQA